MHERTKALQFSPETRAKIVERDGGCIFCNILFRMESNPSTATDIMHIVPRSQGGLGIEQNGVLGCRWHHHMLDNGNDGARPYMLQYCEKYMTRLYPGWNKADLVYRKDWTK